MAGEGARWREKTAAFLSSNQSAYAGASERCGGLDPPSAAVECAAQAMKAIKRARGDITANVR